ncbi:hypothetical protein VCCP103710_3348, partial [Vibrio cholerae CP1037(10)]
MVNNFSNLFAKQ